MIAACTAGAAEAAAELTLTDNELEHSSILRLLLDLAYSKPLDNFDLIPCKTMLSLIRLAVKLDCATPLRMISLLVTQPLAPKSSSLNRFYYACALDDVEAAYRFLPAAALQRHPGRAPTGASSTDVPLAAESCLDVCAMSEEWINQLPRKYFLALLRASRWRMITPCAPGIWDTVATEFRAIVRLQSESDGDSQAEAGATS